MWMLSVFCLITTALLCVLGTFSQRFNDNPVQRVGMAFIAYAAIARAVWVWHAETVNPDWLIYHAGVAIYAIGTAFKVQHYWQKNGRHL